MAAKRSGGFTLIELLVVMAILATLVTLGVTVVPYMFRRGDKAAAEMFLSGLQAGLDAYQSNEGAYPPTSLADFPGVGALGNTENVGIESVVLCMNSNRYSGSYDFAETKGSKLENYDGDQTQVQLTRFGGREMFESVDPWGTPYLYFNAKDYARAEDLGKVTLADGTVIKGKPWMSPKTKRPYRFDSFQIFSAGPDATFNTADDVTPFDRE
jgi:prepilin-type N-terminal cleavage/methylation domain-containing protein